MECALKKTGLSLKEAVEHSKFIQYLDCPLCGTIMSDRYNRCEMVRAIRDDGYCESCHFDLYNNPERWK